MNPNATHIARSSTLKMKNLQLISSKIGVRAEPLLPRYACITENTISEPIPVILNDESSDPPYLAVTKPASIGSKIDVIVYPDVPKKQLCLLTFFRANWSPNGKPSAIEIMDIFDELLRKEWKAGDITAFSGWQKALVADYIHITTEICDELKAVMRTGLAGKQKKKLLPLATLKELRYFPAKYQLAVFNLLVNCDCKVCQMRLVKMIRDEVRIKPQISKPAIVPDLITLPTQEEVDKFAASIKQSD